MMEGPKKYWIGKDNLLNKKLMDQSLMTQGLAPNMSEEDLVDLVEYLGTLEGRSLGNDIECVL